MPRRSVLHVHSVLLQMIRQDFTVPVKPSVERKRSRRPDKQEKGHVWEVRHAGLLGIKYEVAVRGDVVEEEVVKMEDGTMIEPDIARATGRDILQDVVDAAILG